INSEWLFVKNTTDIAAEGGVSVNLPHTWNAEDGFDGGNDYFRGSCIYKKTITRAELPEASRLAPEDKWILTEYNKTVATVVNALDHYEIGVALSAIYDFIWDIFCDWYIEIAKIRLNSDDKANVKAVLIYVMSNTLKLLHPFMPFITEEIWQTLPHEGESIMVSDFPVYNEELCFESEYKDFERVATAIKAIRARRGEMNVAPSKKAAIHIVSNLKDVFSQSSAVIAKLASGSSVEICDNCTLENTVNIVTEDAKIYIPLGELVDFEAEKKRLNKEKDATLKILTQINNKLSNEGFLAKAPEKVIEEQREKQKSLNEKLQSLEEELAKLN
ncbi:MAG: class I tRNA ligase family protein, partial [Acutalibacteraceae bacterium]|nr:class I tRNA ligase family protein [Acutalibacteraceae bacterium]